MAVGAALDHAFDLVRAPNLAGAMQRQELPADIVTLIRIAGGCPETCWEAVQATRQSPEAVREAARTYLQLILFAEGNDCFRTLGVVPGTPKSLIREHMRWLLQWLHPDRNRNEWESVYAERVIDAWRKAKSTKVSAPARSQVSVSVAAPREPERKRPGRIRAPIRWIPVPIEKAPSRINRKLQIGAAVFMLSLIILAAPYFEPVAGWLEEPANTAGTRSE